MGCNASRDIEAERLPPTPTHVRARAKPAALAAAASLLDEPETAPVGGVDAAAGAGWHDDGDIRRGVRGQMRSSASFDSHGLSSCADTEGGDCADVPQLPAPAAVATPEAALAALPAEETAARAAHTATESRARRGMTVDLALGRTAISASYARADPWARFSITSDREYPGATPAVARPPCTMVKARAQKKLLAGVAEASRDATRALAEKFGWDAAVAAVRAADMDIADAHAALEAAELIEAEAAARAAIDAHETACWKTFLSQRTVGFSGQLKTPVVVYSDVEDEPGEIGVRRAKRTRRKGASSSVLGMPMF